MKFTRIALLALCAAVMGSVGNPVQAEDEASSPAVKMAAAANAFARDLYGHVSGGDENLFFSPHSVHACMLLAREGAAGETARQMDAVLRLSGMEPGVGYRGLTGALMPPLVKDGWGKQSKQVPAYALDIANSVWGQQGYAFEAPYVDRLAEIYGAPLARVDFGDVPNARKIINDWVSKATRKKIEDIVPEGMPPPLTRMVLANAIYMKASWARPFEQRWTKEAEFTGPDGTKSKAQLMHRLGHLKYAEIQGVQVLELPYRGDHLKMVVYLPKTAADLKDAETKLREGRLDGKTSRKLVDVRLPKWKFTTSLDLTTVLQKMGMSMAFDGAKADFSAMTKSEKLHIGVVLHKAFVAVDEAGTEAAAATIAIMRAGSAPRPEEQIPFRADHPFLFEIRHSKTGTILFAGRVMRP